MTYCCGLCAETTRSSSPVQYKFDREAAAAVVATEPLQNISLFPFLWAISLIGCHFGGCDNKLKNGLRGLYTFFLARVWPLGTGKHHWTIISRRFLGYCQSCLSGPALRGDFRRCPLASMPQQIPSTIFGATIAANYQTDQLMVHINIYMPKPNSNE